MTAMLSAEGQGTRGRTNEQEGLVSGYPIPVASYYQTMSAELF